MLPIIGQGWKEKAKDYFSEDKEVEGVVVMPQCSTLRTTF